MTDIIIHEGENNDPPVEEIVEELTDTTETVVEELTDTIETLADTIETLEENQHKCDPHCEELHRKIAELEDRITVTQEHIVDDKIDEIQNSDPEPEPEPEPVPLAPEPEPTTEETLINPEETMIEPPPNRTEKSGPNGFFRALKAIGF